MSIVIEQFTGNISDNCLVKVERDRHLTVTKVRKSESAAICNMFREISTRWQTFCYIYSCVKQGTVFQTRFEFPKKQQTENEEFYHSKVQQFSSSKIQHFNSLTDVKICSDSNNINTSSRIMWRWVTTKPEGVPEGTTSAVDIARDHHSNENNNTEEQTYGLFCSSFTFTQTRPCISRTECFVRLPCVMLYAIMYG